MYFLCLLFIFVWNIFIVSCLFSLSLGNITTFFSYFLAQYYRTKVITGQEREITEIKIWCKGGEKKHRKKGERKTKINTKEIRNLLRKKCHKNHSWHKQTDLTLSVNGPTQLRSVTCSLVGIFSFLLFSHVFRFFLIFIFNFKDFFPFLGEIILRISSGMFWKYKNCIVIMIS